MTASDLVQRSKATPTMVVPKNSSSAIGERKFSVARAMDESSQIQGNRGRISAAVALPPHAAFFQLSSVFDAVLGPGLGFEARFADRFAGAFADAVGAVLDFR